MQMATTIESETGEMIVKRVSVPLGLEELMEGLTKEVILQKPADIYVFASQYFSNLLSLREKGALKGLPGRQSKFIIKQPSSKNTEKNKFSKSLDTGKQLTRHISLCPDTELKGKAVNASDTKERRLFLSKRKARISSLDQAEKGTNLRKTVGKSHSISCHSEDPNVMNSSRRGKVSTSSKRDSSKSSSTPRENEQKGTNEEAAGKTKEDREKDKENIKIDANGENKLRRVKSEKSASKDEKQYRRTNSYNEKQKDGSFDKKKLRQEIEEARHLGKMTTFTSSYNPYKLRQETKQAYEQSEKMKQTVAAVVKIQSLWRGYKARKLIKHTDNNEQEVEKIEMQDLKEEVDEIVDKEIINSEDPKMETTTSQFVAAVLKIQALWRGFQLRKKLNNGKLFGTPIEAEYKADEELKSPKRLEDSVAKIQALWRGYKVRKTINNVSELQKPGKCDELPWDRGQIDEERNRAALTIQAGIRGYLQKLRSYSKRSLNSITEEGGGEEESKKLAHETESVLEYTKNGGNESNEKIIEEVVHLKNIIAAVESNVASEENNLGVDEVDEGTYKAAEIDMENNDQLNQEQVLEESLLEKDLEKQGEENNEDSSLDAQQEKIIEVLETKAEDLLEEKSIVDSIKMENEEVLAGNNSEESRIIEEIDDTVTNRNAAKELLNEEKLNQDEIHATNNSLDEESIQLLESREEQEDDNKDEKQNITSQKEEMNILESSNAPHKEVKEKLLVKVIPDQEEKTAEITDTGINEFCETTRNEEVDEIVVEENPQIDVLSRENKEDTPINVLIVKEIPVDENKGTDEKIIAKEIESTRNITVKSTETNHLFEKKENGKGRNEVSIQEDIDLVNEPKMENEKEEKPVTIDVLSKQEELNGEIIAEKIKNSEIIKLDEEQSSVETMQENDEVKMRGKRETVADDRKEDNKNQVFGNDGLEVSLIETAEAKTKAVIDEGNVIDEVVKREFINEIQCLEPANDFTIKSEEKINVETTIDDKKESHSLVNADSQFLITKVLPEEMKESLEEKIVPTEVENIVFVKENDGLEKEDLSSTTLQPEIQHENSLRENLDNGDVIQNRNTVEQEQHEVIQELKLKEEIKEVIVEQMVPETTQDAGQTIGIKIADTEISNNKNRVEDNVIQDNTNDDIKEDINEDRLQKIESHDTLIVLEANNLKDENTEGLINAVPADKEIENQLKQILKKNSLIEGTVSTDDVNIKKEVFHNLEEVITQDKSQEIDSDIPSKSLVVNNLKEETEEGLITAELEDKKVEYQLTVHLKENQASNIEEAQLKASMEDTDTELNIKPGDEEVTVKENANPDNADTKKEILDNIEEAINQDKSDKIESNKTLEVLEVKHLKGEDKQINAELEVKVPQNEIQLEEPLQNKQTEIIEESKIAGSAEDSSVGLIHETRAEDVAIIANTLGEKHSKDEDTEKDVNHEEKSRLEAEENNRQNSLLDEGQEHIEITIVKEVIEAAEDTKEKNGEYLNVHDIAGESSKEAREKDKTVTDNTLIEKHAKEENDEVLNNEDHKSTLDTGDNNADKTLLGEGQDNNEITEEKEVVETSEDTKQTDAETLNEPTTAGESPPAKNGDSRFDNQIYSTDIDDLIIESMSKLAVIAPDEIKEENTGQEVESLKKESDDKLRGNYDSAINNIHVNKSISLNESANKMETSEIAPVSVKVNQTYEEAPTRPVTSYTVIEQTNNQTAANETDTSLSNGSNLSSQSLKSVDSSTSLDSVVTVIFNEEGAEADGANETLTEKERKADKEQENIVNVDGDKNLNAFLEQDHSKDLEKTDRTIQHVEESIGKEAAETDAKAVKGAILKNDLEKEVNKPGLLHSGEFHDSILFQSLHKSEKVVEDEQQQSKTEESVVNAAVSLEDPNQAPPAGVELLTSSESSSIIRHEIPAQASSQDDGSTVESLQNATLSRSMESAKRNNASIPTKSMESEAATKIQAGFRGYQVRKQLKSKISSPGDITNQRRSLRRKSSGKVIDTSRSIKNPSDIEEKSAVKIQAGVRGFLVRRRQKKQKQGKE